VTIGAEHYLQEGQGMQAVTDATFNNVVLMSEKPVLVFFWATWSGPSRLEAPILEQIASEHTDTLSVVQLEVVNRPGFGRDSGGWFQAAVSASS
jgi:thioredoxin 1